MLRPSHFLLFAKLSLIAGVSGCASMGFGYDEDALKQQVSFETRCPESQITVGEALDAGIGHTKFRINACGAEQRWDRFGTSYFPEGKGPMSMGAPTAAASAPAECQTHLQCKGGLVCPKGHCVAPVCIADAQCAAGQMCTLEGVCEPASGGAH